jgi:hypothetical protein
MLRQFVATPTLVRMILLIPDSCESRCGLERVSCFLGAVDIVDKSLMLKVSRIWIWGAFLLASLNAAGAAVDPGCARVALPGNTGELRGEIELEYAWRFSLEDGVPQGSWDFRWSPAAETSSRYVLTSPPVIEWDAFVKGRRLGVFRDRFHGNVPADPGVWGKGRTRRGFQLLNSFRALANGTSADHRPRLVSGDLWLWP